jgi:pyruvyl transferase EpsI
VTFGDTVDVALEDCTPETYEKTLERFWDMLRHRQVVVTDRLHCMIFCALTRTPCVVLSNSNHKIEGVYRTWLESLPYITFSGNLHVEDLLAAVAHLKGLDLRDVPPLDLTDEFQPLRDALRAAALS